MSERIAVLVALMALVGCASASYFGQEAELQISADGHLVLPMGPYLLFDRSGNILVGADLPKGRSGELSWWLQGTDEVKTTRLQPAWDKLVYAPLPDLLPGETYSYNLTVDGVTTDTYQVKGAVPADEPFRFLVVGDTRLGCQQIHGRLMKQMEQRSPAFYIHLGDFVRFGECLPDWDTFFSVQTDLLATTPILPLGGNHDISEVGIFRGLFLFPQRLGEDRLHYATRMGNTLVVILDSNSAIPKGGAQYRFLEDQLKGAESQGIQHIFIALHTPLYSAGAHGSNPGLRATLQPLLARYGVDAVFAGHDHQYQRSHPIDGVVHVVSGGGGAELHSVDQKDFTAVAILAFHFLEIEIDGEHATLRAINVEGRVLDEVPLK